MRHLALTAVGRTWHAEAVRLFETYPPSVVLHALLLAAGVVAVGLVFALIYGAVYGVYRLGDWLDGYGV